jgi:hypothetical protein
MATLGGSTLTSPARGGTAGPFFAPLAPSAAAPSRSAIEVRPLAREPVSVPRRGGELRGALVLVVGWILLWAYFVVGVAEQAAAFRGAAEGSGAGAPAGTGATVEVRVVAPRVVK